jgi:glutamate synthase (NADPH/NADH) small chain
LPPLTAHEAVVESNRCLYCYDAPCTHACPTHIDIPRFIKKIASGNLTGSGRTILESNLMGATCARVCPVEELCEGACVLNAEERPISIGRLQRHAMDHIYASGRSVFQPAEPAGRKVAVIGAGPAGLSCAGELARRGHTVTIFEKRNWGGGLSTYGIIALREPISVALAEVEMIRSLGVTIETGAQVNAAKLPGRFDAVFIAAGLGKSPQLGIPGEEYIVDGLAFIEQSKTDIQNLRVGRNVLVIGAGNTAIDCATVAKRCGANRVTMVYRRNENEMSAYRHEYEFIKNEGVRFEFLAQPVSATAEGLECVRAGSNFVLAGDQIIKAIGQEKTGIAAVLGLVTERGFIKVNAQLETSMPRVYAGGDCVRAKGSASTVMAAQDGKIGAASIHDLLMNGVKNG